MATLTLQARDRFNVQLIPARLATTILTAFAVTVGIALRWLSLGKKVLSLDEGYTAWVVSHPIGQIIRIIRVDTAPPLYYILLHGWSLILGRTELALRSMSAVMATVTLLIFMLIARRLLDSLWGRSAAVFLFCFAFMQAGYAHEARFYSMLTLLGAIDLYLVLLVCQRSTVLRLSALVIAWTLSLYTNNMMAVYLACLSIGWFILPGERSFRGRFRDAFIVGVTSAMLYAPWLPTMLNQSRRLQSGFWPDVPDAVTVLRTIGMMAGVHEQSLPRNDLHQFLVVDVLLFGLALLACGTSRGKRIVAALILFATGPIVLIFIYSHLKTSIFIERAFLPSGITFPLLLAMGLETTKSKPAKFVAVLGILCFCWLDVRSICGRYTGEPHEDWRDACTYADQSAPIGGKHLTLCAANEVELLYDYYVRQGDYSPRADLTGSPMDFFQMDPPRTLQRVTSDADLRPLRQKLAQGNYDSVTFICSHTWWGDPDARALKLLLANYRKVDDRQFRQIHVFQFVRRSRES